MLTRLRALLTRAPRIRVDLMIKGRVGDGWLDISEQLMLPPGSTLADLIAHVEARDIPLLKALESSPHLRHTVMLNGQRCPVDDNLARVLGDGDQLYLLAPLAGG